MITLELPDGTKRPTPITDIDSIRVARGGTDLPELVRLGVIVTYTDGTFDAVVGSFASVCAKIAAVAMTLDDIVGLHAELGQSISAAHVRAPADILTDPQPLRDPKTEPEIGDFKCWLNIGETQTAEVTAVYYGDFKVREVDVLVDGEHGDCWTIAKWSERWDGVYWVTAKTGEPPTCHRPPHDPPTDRSDHEAQGQNSYRTSVQQRAAYGGDAG